MLKPIKRIKIDCAECNNLLIEDANAPQHWRYYCEKCRDFKILKGYKLSEGAN